MKNGRIQVSVNGRVQGVCFRTYTEEKATGLGLTGTVKNISDGSVYVVAEGGIKKLEEFLIWLNNGPPMAEVNNIVKEWKPFEGLFSSFKIIY